MKKFCKRAVLGLLMMLLAVSVLLVRVQPVMAGATITVTTQSDEYDKNYPYDDHCSLREAITAANTDSRFGGCPAGSGADLIVLPSLSGDYYRLQIPNSPSINLDSNETGDLDIKTSITIVGDGPEYSSVRVDSGITLNDRIFHVIQPSGQPMIKVNFYNVSIQYGTASDLSGGGAILNDRANVTISRVTISENNSNRGGGGVSSPRGGVLTITKSKISNNQASLSGGGINAYGTLKISDSLVYLNRASSGGGIAYLPGDGNTEIAVITNTTIGNNSSGTGSGINISGRMELYHVTLVNNSQSPGIVMQQDSSLKVANSIIALSNTLAPGETNCMVETNVTASVDSLGGNVVGDYNPSAVILPAMARTACEFISSTDQPDQLGITADELALEGALTYAGNTGVFAFSNNSSVAIDSIPSDNTNCQPLDQFFHPRPWNLTVGGCDAGAYEQGSYFEFTGYLPMVRR